MIEVAYHVLESTLSKLAFHRFGRTESAIRNGLLESEEIDILIHAFQGVLVDWVVIQIDARQTILWALRF